MDNGTELDYVLVDLVVAADSFETGFSYDGGEGLGLVGDQVAVGLALVHEGGQLAD